MAEEHPERALELRSLVTDAGTVELSLVEVDVPVPSGDDVLVRVEAAPINPSDLGLLLAGADVGASRVSGTAERPVVTAPLDAGAARAATARLGQSMPVGNEGAGRVVAAGPGDTAQALVGRTVAVAGGGMYTQYRCLPAAACLPLPDGTGAVDGAAAFVNPMTALAMVETMRAEGHTGLVHTAAASNLGQMLNRICLEDGVPLVNIVRSPAQVELLRAAGAAFVCDSSSETFMDDLTAALRATSATLAFDAVGGGTLASRILTAMEVALTAGAEFSRYGSTTHKQVYLYGSLDRGPTELRRSYGMAWGVGGWLLTPFLVAAGSERVEAMRQRVAAGLTTTFASHFSDQVTLAGALDLDSLTTYSRMGTGRKFLVTPNG
ncbi:MAG: zinc-binding dehydrogenase [Actinomycetota bacterium]|nr:zinc-binding dehydrogenase [Actinomycetota bacterium]